VRSQAYQNPEPGPEAAHRVGSHNRVVRSGPPQDLKRIRGIGVLIERRLNAMQIATYEQIANWTAEDIERVSRTLDFKGRIERENWVEQARILASGGATEFSRRVDRGDVETGRYRP
jgi:predicted flap endonuclease-1-like 5' DNA nuclease